MEKTLRTLKFVLAFALIFTALGVFGTVCAALDYDSIRTSIMPTYDELEIVEYTYYVNEPITLEAQINLYDDNGKLMYGYYYGYEYLGDLDKAWSVERMEYMTEFADGKYHRLYSAVTKESFSDNGKYKHRYAEFYFRKPGVYEVLAYKYWHISSGYIDSQRYYLIRYTIEERTPITQDIEITNDAVLVAGQEFVAPTIPETEQYKIRETYLIIGDQKILPGETIPEDCYGAAQVYITIDPARGYYYDEYQGAATIDAYINGEKVGLSVVNSAAEGIYADFYIDSYVRQPLKKLTLNDVEAPYHRSELDYTGTIPEGECRITKIEYVMFGKVMDMFEAGESGAMRVYVECSDKYALDDKCRMTWNGKINEVGVKVSDTERMFGFMFDVEAKPEQYVYNFIDFTVDGIVNDTPIAGELIPTECTPETAGVVVKSISWSPADTRFIEGKEYTLTVTFDHAEKYLWIDNFLDNTTFRVNYSEDGVSVKEAKRSGGIKQKFQTDYILTKTFKPAAVDQTPKSFVIDVDYDPASVSVVKGGSVTLSIRTNLDFELADDLSIQWYKTSSNIYGTGTAIEGANGATLTVSADKVGTAYYYCSINCRIGNELGSSDSDEAAMVKVTVTDKNKEPFRLLPASEQNVVVYSDETDFVFETKVENTDGQNVDYFWYRCDKDGAELESEPTGRGSSLLIFGINSADKMKTFYYKCSAYCGEEYDSVIFSCMLLPEKMGEEPVGYKFPFTDVPKSEWYYKYVEASNKIGLINGKTLTEYMPTDNMRLCEAVKLAVCMNIIYNGGDPSTDIANGTDVWYSTYEKYAIEHGILGKEGMNGEAEKLVTRSEYVYIFSKALPESAFEKINTIPNGSIPDVKSVKTAQEKAVYTFYRAGILNGMDGYGTFNPTGNISRSEVAAILIRIMDPSYRVGAPELLGRAQ